MPQEWFNALMGGIIIGISVSLMLLWNGRVTGISGIVYAILFPTKGDVAWRVTFILGLVTGGLILRLYDPHFFKGQLMSELSTTIIAGLFVGFGTTLGSGCTSGHGVCGISRMSFRSIVATITFILAGVLTVMIFKKVVILE